MKANELMLGDWVRIKITQHDTTVTNIDENSVYTEAVFPIRYDEIEPIPLTADILEKNGFVISNEEPVIDKVGVSIIYGRYKRIDEDQCTNYGDGLYPIKYVHQLQHALRLCGIEKEIIL